ncbi:entry/fusion complex component myristylprotein [Pteropox virus]|uniref:Entry/fusion complex component myristylprotein n=1 Tax=Pteropox virus TaxID=1873698 RepID=A0A1B1MRD8_9POXV|nr:entry/fusion complex component myristylprotein [Pteropox virus]ANS71148.1 entry/fusion complex component myristylprotein [Pteropox virus]
MGGGITLPERTPPPPVPTGESKLKVTDVLMAIPNLKIGDFLRIGNKENSPNVTAMLPEFALHDVGIGTLSEITRIKYNASNQFCCSSFKNKYYWLLPDKSISLNYKDNAVLYTCDPDTFDKGNCDMFLFNLCKTTTDNSDLCSQWIVESFNRHELPSRISITSFDKLKKMLIDSCSKDATTQLCKSWLQALRNHRSEANDLLVDQILLSQSVDFKQKYMKCSFPSIETEEKALKINEPRECWDPECAQGEIHYMLTKNFNNLGLCQLTRCNISINQLSMDDNSKLRMACKTNSENFSSAPVNQAEVIYKNVQDSFSINFELMIVMFFLIICITIVMF